MDATIHITFSLNCTDDTLAAEIRRNCGVDVELCLECGKCSGGCPNGHLFDFTPRKIVRLVKLGDRQTLMTMDALWMCLSCQACFDRCPSGIDIPAVLDYLREKGCNSGAKESRPLVRLFHELILSSIRERGRVAETGVALKYNLKAGQYLKDTRLGLRMLVKGKLSLRHKGVKQREEVRRLFEKGTPAKDGSR